MPDFRLSKPPRKEKPPADPNAEIGFTLRKAQPAQGQGPKPQRAKPKPKVESTISTEQSKSLLSQAGGTALSGLHTIGSILSTPSRVLWGTINGVTGGDGGFGNMNPLDSTGGIELSHVLGNAGVLPKNDPNAWEWSDVGRGLVDIAGDPTTWLTPLGLTRAGVAAAKRAPLAGNYVNQIARGERGLVGFRPPFAVESRGAIGSGQSVADAIENVGHRTGASQAIGMLSRSAPVVKAKQLFHASSMGRSTHNTQVAAEQAYREAEGGQRFADLAAINSARNMQARGPIPGEAERHLAEMGRPTAEMAPLMQHKDALQQHAQQLGIPIGDLNNDVKAFTKIGQRRAHQTHVLDNQGNVVRTIQNQVDPRATDVGIANFLAPNTAVEHVPRYAGEGVEWGGHGGDGSRLAMAARSPLFQHRNQELFGNAPTELIESAVRSTAGVQPRLAEAGMSANQQARILGKLIKRNAIQGDIAAGTNLTRKFANAAGREMDRTRELGQFLQANPQVAETGLFTNHPVFDLHRQISGLNDTTAKARAAIGFMAEHGRPSYGEPLDVLRRNRMDNPPTIRDASGQLGLQPDAVAGRVAGAMPAAVRAQVQAAARQEAERIATHRSGLGASAQDIADMADTLEPDLFTQGILNLQLPAREYNSLTGFLDAAPRGEPGLLGDLNTVWKANMLAHPATQSRNAVSGLVTNLMQGAVSPSSMRNAVNLLRGQNVSGYSQVPEVANLMRQQGIDETEALRRLSGTYFPSNHSIAGDLPPGQAGTSLEDMVSNVPGQTPVPVSETVMGPARALAGYENGTHVGWNAINPAAIGGAFGHETTRFAPAMASNMIAGNVEQANRISGWLGLLEQGYSANEAARIIGKSQVNYGPKEFSQFEKQLKQVIPFYSFTSRAGRHVAGELASDPGGRLGQLVKAQNRSHSEDPSTPDSVLSGTALPLADGADGSKRFITGFGFQHEPIVHTLGALAGGNLRGAGYDVLGMLNPLLKTPAEYVTGQSFYQRGEDNSNLDPVLGRTAANVLGYAGRDSEDGPVTFPGSAALETVFSASPLSRLGTTARTLTDGRKTLPERLSNVLTGLKITDVNKKRQQATLIKRAESLAKEFGAKSRSDVYFNKRELEHLEKSNPELAKRQRELQRLLGKLKKKQTR